MGRSLSERMRTARFHHCNKNWCCRCLLTAVFLLSLLLLGADQKWTLMVNPTVCNFDAHLQTSNALAAARVLPTNCSTVEHIPPINIGQMRSLDQNPYFVSFSWWEVRLRRPAYKNGGILQANPAVLQVQRLLQNVSTEKAFIDVGANVGFMSMFAVQQQRPVIAIDPISYDIAKLCEGYQANQQNKTYNNDGKFYLYHAAAGATNQAEVNITRPSDKIGHFDQSSLTRDNLQQNDIVTEQIPMVRVDSIVPDDLPVGVVKIDVQGHEYAVLSGMTRIFSRSVGYPSHIFFEDHHGLTMGAGYVPGSCAELLRGFGYDCENQGMDTLCTRY